MPCGKYFIKPCSPGRWLCPASARLLARPVGPSALLLDVQPCCSPPGVKPHTRILRFVLCFSPWLLQLGSKEPGSLLEMWPSWEPCSQQLFCSNTGWPFQNKPASVSQLACSVLGSLGWNRDTRLTRTSRLAALFVSPTSRISSFPPSRCQHSPYPSAPTPPGFISS